MTGIGAQDAPDGRGVHGRRVDVNEGKVAAVGHSIDVDGQGLSNGIYHDRDVSPSIAIEGVHQRLIVSTVGASRIAKVHINRSVGTTVVGSDVEERGVGAGGGLREKAKVVLAGSGGVHP